MGVHIQIMRGTVAPPPVVVLPPLWRVKHDIELGPLWRPGLPEVHPFAPSHFSTLTRAWQELSFALNPQLSRTKWRAVHADDRAFTNHHGFEADDHPARRDYINMRDTGEEFEFPKQEALICGGNIVTGRVVGLTLIIHTLNGRLSPPRASALMPWETFDAVSVDGNGTPRLFPQGGGVRVRLPLLADRLRYPVLTFPLEKLQRWTAQELPDPYRVYL